ncbi:MAG TPA: VOC family protein [Marmoricola sp.]
MSSRLNPYVSFRDDAREALEFYRSVFGGELNTSTFGDFGDPKSPEAKLIMHGMLETSSGFTLMAADTPPGMDFDPGSRISISLSGDDEAELRGYWDKLAEGATVTMPLEKQMWGDVFGMCTDRFGVTWMVNIAGDGS